MAYICFDFKRPQKSDWVFDSTIIGVTRKQGIVLLKTDDDGNLDPLDGTFKEGDIIFDNVKGTAITKLVGCSARGIEPDDTSISFQISSDDGVTFNFFDGADWVVAGANDFTEPKLFSENLESYPFSSARQFKLKMRMTPSPDGTRAPTVFAVAIFFAVRYNLTDDIKRTIKRHIEANLSCLLKWAVLVTSPISSVVLNSTFEKVIGIEAVYDIVADPERVTDLFDSFDSGTNTVTFTSVIPSGNAVEIEYTARPKIMIGADHDFEAVDTPTVVFWVDESTEQWIYTYEQFQDESGPNDVVRQQRVAPVREYEIMLHCLGANKNEIIPISDGAHNLLSRDRPITSLATAHCIDIFNYIPMRNVDYREMGSIDRLATFIASAEELQPESEVRTLARVQEINLSVSNVPPGKTIVGTNIQSI